MHWHIAKLVCQPAVFYMLGSLKKNVLTCILKRFNVCSLRTGVYGDVHRVKILFNKKDNALIQMADPHQAQLGKFEVCIPLHLNAKNLSIKPSASRVPSMTLLSHHLCLKNRQTKAVCHSTGYLGD